MLELRVQHRLRVGREGHPPVRPLRLALLGVVMAFGMAEGSAGLQPATALAAAPSGFSVIPFPGTPDASTHSEILFLGLQPSQLENVAARGSHTGGHAGQLEALPDQRGTAFRASRPFSAGETVSVRAQVAASTGGAPASTASTSLGWTFAVAVVDPGAGAARSGRRMTGIQPARTAAQVQRFVSRPDLRPPPVTVSTAAADPDSGFVFVDIQHGRQVGPMILDARGRLVWFHPLHGDEGAFDVRVQTYLGRPVLTYWVGQQDGTHGGGRDVVLDRAYRTVATVHAAEGYTADLHEFLITPQNTALITSYARVHADLRSVHGLRRGLLLDCVVQELDIATGRLLWEWHALGHVPVRDTRAGRPFRGQAFDYFHVNSIQQLPGGDLLISARNTWAIYRVSHSTGRIIWQLGGRHSTFRLGPRARFAWQHDAQLQPSGELTVFDNEASPNVRRQSRAITLGLDSSHRRAWLISLYTHAPPVLAASQGSMQILPNGNVFVGWGAEPEFSEYARTGRQLFSASFPTPVVSYRAFRFPWTGRPSGPPVAAVRPAPGGRVRVYVSWNGATGASDWQLEGGMSPSSLKPLRRVRSAGFETTISARTKSRYLAVRALDSRGQALGTSATVKR